VVSEVKVIRTIHDDDDDDDDGGEICDDADHARAEE
jgi:hypothetical protein